MAHNVGRSAALLEFARPEPPPKFPVDEETHTWSR